MKEVVLRKKLIKCMMSILSFLACFAAMGVQDLKAASNIISNERIEELDNYLQEVSKYYHIPGMAVTVVNANEELFAKTYGDCTDREKMFFIGSESKSFTATCIMQLYEKGLIDLDADITTYLPELAFEKPITVKQLLNQNSGLGTHQNFKTMKILDHYNEFTYANINYDLLGKIVEAVSGQTYAQYVQEHIFNPIGMKHSTADLEVAKKSEMVPGHRNYFGIPIVSKSAYPTEKSWFNVPAGYIASSPVDMGKYLQMYLRNGKTVDGEQVLAESSIMKMFYDSILQDRKSMMRYGMGWMTLGEWVSHGGQVENYITFMVVFPGRNLAISLLYNVNDELFTNHALMYEIPENVNKIISGMKSESVDHSQYWKTHIAIDTICALLLLFSGFLLWNAIRTKKNLKGNIVQWILMLILNVAFPTFILNFTELLLDTPLWVVKSYVNDLWWVLIISAALAYLGGVVKVLKRITSRK